VFPANTIYITGLAKSQLNNPITHQFGRFVLCFVVDRGTGGILACSSSTVMEITAQFLQSIFVGKSMITDSEKILSEIQNRYFGASQKAIIVAYRDAQRRFQNIKKGVPLDFNWD
jgi:hypothetical protein